MLAFNSNKQQQRTLNDELAVMESQQQALVQQLESLHVVLTQEEQAHSMQAEKVEAFKSALERLRKYQTSVKAQLEAHSLPTHNFAVMPDASLALTAENLQTRIDNLQSKREARAEIAERIQGFVRHQVLENDDQLMRPFVDDDLLAHAFEQLQSRYQGLDEEFDILRKHFVEHKHSIHGIINELKNNREMVRQFELSINRAFAGVTINDLSQVEATIKVEARFSDLVGEIEHLDTHSDQKASEQFIERLKAFSQKFSLMGKQPC
ncbi:myosin heavy chain [Photobacterium aphoticum]|uniref:Myosin heavy chain n=1 Tax=Photobacterium aphoticum TaxID=754436 RepID=A0A090R8U8_9GAMM|nr:myosin heavy chain [Photobacterium aphoticum]